MEIITHILGYIPSGNGGIWMSLVSGACLAGALYGLRTYGKRPKTMPTGRQEESLYETHDKIQP